MKSVLVGLSLIVALLCIPIGAQAVDSVLTWGANTEVDLAGYKIYQSEVSGQYGAPIRTVGKVVTSTIVLPQLSVDKKYFFTITAYDLTGNESGKSNEVNNTVVGVPVIGIPTNFKATIINGKTVFSWDVVPNVSGYLLHVHKKGTPYDPCSSMSVCTTVPIGGMSYTATLEVGEYDAWINAATSPTVFGDSQGLTLVIDVSQIDTPPLPPQGLMISKATEDEVVIIASVIDCPKIVTSIERSTSVTKQTVSCVQ